VATFVALAVMTGACSSDDGGEEGAPPASAAGGEFSLLSYNVAGLPQEVSSENPEEHLPLISPLLNEYDLVLTQEDFDWWGPQVAELDFVNYHDRLRADTDHPFATEPHPGPEAVGIDGTDTARPVPYVGDGLGFLSRFPFTDVERVPWSRCYGVLDGASDCMAMKGFAVGTFELAEGVLVDVYTLHAEAGEGPQDQPLQVENFEQLADFVTERSAGRAVILAGDTNLHLEPDHDQRAGDRSIWEEFLETTGLSDTCAVVDCPVEGAIDKVAFRNSDGLTLEPRSFAHADETFSTPEGEDLSDHPPVVVEWSWTAES
jgi:endonuclease/exonuclease/phosphatase family metal-dependent hydrolase